MRATSYCILLVLSLLSMGAQKDKLFEFLSTKATAYHLNQFCQGLNRCTHEVVVVSKGEAVLKYNRRLCGYED